MNWNILDNPKRIIIKIPVDRKSRKFGLRTLKKAKNDWSDIDWNEVLQLDRLKKINKLKKLM